MKSISRNTSLMPKITTVILNVFFLACSFLSANAQDTEQRIINKVPKHLPIKVEITNGDMGSRLEDVKIKITNIGKKPIYFLTFHINAINSFPYFPKPTDYFPGIPTPTEIKVGLTSFRYGNSKLSGYTETTRTAEESDISLKTNESIEFEIKKKEVDGFNNLLREKGLNSSETSELKLELIFQHLSFGDKTGFWGTTGSPYPSKKQISSFINTHSNGFFLTF